MQTIEQTLRSAFEQLKKTSPTPRMDAELSLLHVLHLSREYLYAHPEVIITEKQLVEYKELIRKRLQGIPVAYLRGHQAFWNIDIAVSPDVLIPRPETERLVEIALETLDKSARLDILECGTGCGAIALALASERQNWQIWATDQSKAALTIAQNNAKRLNLEVTFYHGQWFEAVPTLIFNAIISNPPYIAANDPHLKQGDLRFEPQIALSGGEDGLRDLRLIIEQAPKHLKPEGWLLLEHGYDQHDALMVLMQDAGFTNIHDYQDYAGIDRVMRGQKIK